MQPLSIQTTDRRAPLTIKESVLWASMGRWDLQRRGGYILLVVVNCMYTTLYQWNDICIHFPQRALVKCYQCSTGTCETRTSLFSKILPPLASHLHPTHCPPSVSFPSLRGYKVWDDQRAGRIQGKAELKRFLLSQSIKGTSLPGKENSISQGTEVEGNMAAGHNEMSWNWAPELAILIIRHTHQWLLTMSVPQRPLLVWQSLGTSFPKNVFKWIKRK